MCGASRSTVFSPRSNPPRGTEEKRGVVRPAPPLGKGIGMPRRKRITGRRPTEEGACTALPGFVGSSVETCQTSHFPNDLGRVNRLDEVGLEAALPRSLTMAVEDRERDGRCRMLGLSGQCPYPLQELVPGHPRHRDVAHDDIGTNGLHEAERLGSALRGGDVCTVVEEKRRNDFAGVDIVVNKQDVYAAQETGGVTHTRRHGPVDAWPTVPTLPDLRNKKTFST